jgi:hypothetical protein
VSLHCTCPYTTRGRRRRFPRLLCFAPIKMVTVSQSLSQSMSHDALSTRHACKRALQKAGGCIGTLGYHPCAGRPRHPRPNGNDAERDCASDGPCWTARQSASTRRVGCNDGVTPLQTTRRPSPLRRPRLIVHVPLRPGARPPRRLRVATPAGYRKRNWKGERRRCGV